MRIADFRFTMAIVSIGATSLWAQSCGASVDPAVVKALAEVSVPFVSNVGQWDVRAAFAAQIFAGTVFVTTDGKLVYSLAGTPVTDPAAAQDLRFAHEAPSARVRARSSGWVLTETLVDAGQSPLFAAPVGDRLQEGGVSYAVGTDDTEHHDNVSSYERVSLGDPYPGISVQVRATGGNVEKIFTVARGQSPSQIRIRLDGATKLEIGPRGELIAHTGNGPVSFTAPIAYQDDDAGIRKTVPARYALDTPTNTYGFRIDTYDSGRPLVIDPLLQSTYLGGNGHDNLYAMAIHPTNGDVYVAGATLSSDLPKVGGAEQATKAVGYDAFVTRLNATLTTRLQSTYLGGSGSDFATSIAVHPVTGEVYVAGYTDSVDFPAMTGAEQATKASGNDAFVTRLNATLRKRLQSTYIGGDNADEAYALAIHPASGNVYVAGLTWSTDFPKVAGAEQTSRSGPYDAFVTRLNASLTSRLQSTYLGGDGTDVVSALAIHPVSGAVYVTGFTSSTDLPAVAGAEQASHAADLGSLDAFVTRLNAELTAREQSTYLGGDRGDLATALVLHPATGEVYVGGITYSSDFPEAAGAEQSTHAPDSGLNDGFVTRLNAALTARLQSTYLGGNSYDGVRAMAIHPVTGDVYAAGNTSSTDFPGIVGSGPPTLQGESDGHVTRLNAALTTRLQSIYLGGGAGEILLALAIHPATGELYAAGTTNSSDFPRVDGAEQTTKGADGDSFVSRVTPDFLLANRASLANLALSTGTLAPPFASGTLTYSANVANGSDTIALTPTVGDATMTVTVNGVLVASGSPSAPIVLSLGSNLFNIVVTAQDQVTTKTYGVNVTYAVSAPVLSGATSRKAHGTAGTFDLPLSLVSTDPTIEPRQGPAATVVMTFDKSISGATAAVTEGSATPGVPTISGNDVIVDLTDVANAQYVAILLSDVASADGGAGGSGLVRIGFLAGDVNQNGAVTLSDLLTVNATLAQNVLATNYLCDVNASGTLALSDILSVNAKLTQFLPSP